MGWEGFEPPTPLRYRSALQFASAAVATSSSQKPWLSPSLPAGSARHPLCDPSEAVHEPGLGQLYPLVGGTHVGSHPPQTDRVGRRNQTLVSPFQGGAPSQGHWLDQNHVPRPDRRTTGLTSCTSAQESFFKDGCRWTTSLPSNNPPAPELPNTAPLHQFGLDGSCGPGVRYPPALR